MSTPSPRTHDGSGTTVMWFRRDLRLGDNPALLDACDSAGVLPLFVLDPVAGFQVAYPRADLDHLTHELVAEDVALAHRREIAVVEVQVGAADGGRGDADDRVAGVHDGRVRDGDDLDAVLADPGGGLHRFPFLSRSI